MKSGVLGFLATTLALSILVSCKADEMPQTEQDAYLGCYYYENEMALSITRDGVLSGDQSLLSRRFRIVPHKSDTYLEIEREAVLDRASGLVLKGREFDGFRYKFIEDRSGDVGLEIGDKSSDFDVLPRRSCIQN